MKNKLYLQLLAALGGAWLFYNAMDLGLNTFLTTLLFGGLVIAAQMGNGQTAKTSRVLLFMGAGLLVALYGNAFSVWMSILALFLLASSAVFSLKAPLALVNGTGELITNTWQYFFLSRQEESYHRPKWLSARSLGLLIIPLLITVVFYALYATASPQFAERVNLARLQQPNWEYVSLTALFFYLSFGLAYSLSGQKLFNWQAGQVDTLQRIRRRLAAGINPFFIKWEYQMAMIMLVLLNGLLLVFHIIDLEMVINNAPGEGVHLPKLLHQGVGTLILSIVLAVSLLVYVFRGNLNFFIKNNTLKRLTYAWLLQNGWLAFTTLQKNWWYVAEYGLTWKRIGVWIYLILVMVGLTLTWLKVKEKRSLWWLLRRNVQVALTVLFLMAAAPWSRIISWYNINHAQVTDFDYLFELSLDNTDQLKAAEDRMSWSEANRLHFRERKLARYTQPKNWKSWTLTNLYSYAQLEKMD
jgi:hypothetical protein